MKELRYSEGQAGRRIQAMRLIKEIPEVEEKIKAGSLSLSNISQAQSYFREIKKIKEKEPLFFQTRNLDHPEMSLKLELEGNGKQGGFDEGSLSSKEAIGKKEEGNLDVKKESSFIKRQLDPQEKLEILKILENKSSREGEKVLLGLQKEKPLPKEKERQVSTTHTEVRFVMSEELKKKLEEVRSLLGPKGAMMSFSELLEFMAEASLEQLKIKKFGKKRTTNKLQNPTPAPELQCDTGERDLMSFRKIEAEPSQEDLCFKEQIKSKARNPATKRKSKNQRYVSTSLKHHIWMRDQGKCQNCGSKRNIQWDHIKPIALGGETTEENLRLLCFHCNQRQAMKKMGVGFIQNFWK